MNKADQEAGNKAVDSLINYETVKVNQFFRLVLRGRLFFIFYLIYNYFITFYSTLIMKTLRQRDMMKY